MERGHQIVRLVLSANMPCHLIGQGNKSLPIRLDPAGYCLLPIEKLLDIKCHYVFVIMFGICVQPFLRTGIPEQD